MMDWIKRNAEKVESFTEDLIFVLVVALTGFNTILLAGLTLITLSQHGIDAERLGKVAFAFEIVLDMYVIVVGIWVFGRVLKAVKAVKSKEVDQ